MPNLSPFSLPEGQSSLSVTSTSGYVGLTGTGNQILVQNVGTKECFIAVGADTTVEALNGDSVSVPASSSRIFTISPDANYIAAITNGADTTTLRIARGNGF